jgi:hypothetical protein
VRLRVLIKTHINNQPNYSPKKGKKKCLPPAIPPFGGNLIAEDSPTAPPILGGKVQLAKVCLDGEVSTTNAAPTNKDILPDLESTRGLQSIYTASDETFLRHNFDIPASICI